MERKINEQPVYLNYNRNIKFLGIIDYKSLVIIVIYSIGILTILNFLPIGIEVLMCLFCFLVIPVLAIFCVNLNNESTIDIIYIILKYHFDKKIFVNIKEAKVFMPSLFSSDENYERKRET